MRWSSMRVIRNATRTFLNCTRRRRGSAYHRKAKEHVELGNAWPEKDGYKWGLTMGECCSIPSAAVRAAYDRHAHPNPNPGVAADLIGWILRVRDGTAN